MTLKETFRWFGPSDPVSLDFIRQCGCSGVMTSLHHIPYGELWPLEEIRHRKAQLAEHKLEWSAAESVPVSEAIKLRTGDFERHIENYKETIRNLGREGIEVAIYNFMPVLDWIRTDMAHKLEDGSECLHFDPVRFAAFEIHMLKRAGAQADYTPGQVEKASAFFHGLSAEEAEVFERSIIDVFPGVDLGLSIQDIRDMLAQYKEMDRLGLQKHLRLFLEEVIPVCEEAGVRMAIHPDDPPFAVLGLPRIVCTEEDLNTLLELVDSPANGICFCAGSLSARSDNDLPGMVRRLGGRIHTFHLRSTKRNPDGSFFEAGHLEGSVDMVAVVEAAMVEMKKRRAAGRSDFQVPFRPDHGRRMLDDLHKPPLKTPGYDCIGRLRGLSEIRGLQTALSRTMEK